MAFKGIILLQLVLSLAFSRNLFINGVRGRNLEDIELDRELKILNKPYVKSFKNEANDIIDCVDIYNQPALSHPLLKDHKIQMKPSFFPEGMVNEDPMLANAIETETESKKSCPFGTVPIRRTRKQDLTNARMLFKTYNKNVLSNNNVPPGHHFAIARLARNSSSKYFGARGQVNLQNPQTSIADQFTAALTCIQSGSNNQCNSIQAGWTVNPGLYGDNRTRLVMAWTADNFEKTGCFNTLCPGFVQVHKSTSPGDIIEIISVYGGMQSEITSVIYRDQKTGNWWYVYGAFHEHIGYWPKEIFTSLSGPATDVGWGGEVYSPKTEASPPMGNGHFATEGYSKAAYFRDLQIMDESLKRHYVENNQLELGSTNFNCYDILPFQSHGFLYGGPGGNCPN